MGTKSHRNRTGIFAPDLRENAANTGFSCILPGKNGGEGVFALWARARLGYKQ